MNISEEKEIIASAQSIDCPAEAHKELINLLWSEHSSFIAGQVSHFFRNSNYCDYADIYQESFLTFYDVVMKFDISRNNRLRTALLLPLHHTFYQYISRENGRTIHENQMVTHFQVVLDRYGLTGQEDLEILTQYYNLTYPASPITAKSMFKYRQYYLMGYKTSLDTVAYEFMPDDFSVENHIALHDTREQLQKCITAFKKTEQQSLLLFLFRLSDHITLNGIHYGNDLKHFPKKQFKCSLDKLLPRLLNVMYQNGLITEKSMEEFYFFLESYYADIQAAG